MQCFGFVFICYGSRPKFNVNLYVFLPQKFGIFLKKQLFDICGNSLSSSSKVSKICRAAHATILSRQRICSGNWGSTVLRCRWREAIKLSRAQLWKPAIYNFFYCWREHLNLGRFLTSWIRISNTDPRGRWIRIQNGCGFETLENREPVIFQLSHLLSVSTQRAWSRMPSPFWYLTNTYCIIQNLMGHSVNNRNSECVEV